jgi:FkbM family methyltransferase
MYLIDPGKQFVEMPSNGFFLNEKNVAHWMFRDGIAEKNLIDWCGDTFGNPDKLFLDIGAHVGSYSWSLAPKFAHVHAFEPNRPAYNGLCANSLLRGLSHKITTHCSGISSVSAKLPYYIRSTDGGGNGFEHLGHDRDHATPMSYLETKTLDSYNFDDIGFIKIDVEGHEISVLEGARETLERNGRPTFMFESWSKQTQPEMEMREDLFTYIQKIGYKIVPIRGFADMFLAEKA